MRVLFITSNYLSGGAVSNCLNNIFGQLTEEFEIDVACMSKVETLASDFPIRTYKISSVHTTSLHEQYSKYKNLELYALKLISKSNVLPYSVKYKMEHARSYKETEEIVKNNNYDVLISVCAMFSNHYIAYRLKKIYPNLKWIAYYFDPFSFNHVEKTSFKSRLNFENKMLEKSNGIIITEQMEKEFSSCVLKRHLKKAIVCEFPNMVERKSDTRNSRIEFSKKKINCVFTGFIYSNVRDPRHFLNMLIKANENIELYIVGSISRATMEQTNMDYYKEKLKDRLHLVDSVPLDEAFRIMNDADILVNFGNSVKNQLPSKIIDYISTGKPIVNVCKYRDCLTIPYMEKYPFSLNIFEEDIIDEEAVEKLETFCFENRGKRADFIKLNEIYKKSTPGYVAEQVIHLLRG